MKILLTILLLLTASGAFAQRKADYIIMPSNEFINSHDSILHEVFPFNDSKIHYELIINADSLKKNDLFQRAKIWQIKMLSHPKYSQQFEDKEGGFIALQASFTAPYSDPLSDGQVINLSFFFSVKIYLKDYKAKIVIDDIKMISVKSQQEPIESHFQAQVKDADYMISQLPKRMQKKFNNYDERENELKELAKMYEYANIEFIALMDDFKNAITSKSESDF